MDHFALPGDELVVAQENGTLHRNFQGYSTRVTATDRLGVSSIGKVATTTCRTEDAARVLRRARSRRARRAPRPDANARRRDPPRRDPADHVLRVLDYEKTGERFASTSAATSRASCWRSSRWLPTDSPIRRPGAARAARGRLPAAPPRHGVRRLPRSAQAAQQRSRRRSSVPPSLGRRGPLGRRPPRRPGRRACTSSRRHW